MVNNTIMHRGYVYKSTDIFILNLAVELPENIGVSTRAIEKQISKLKENKTIKRIGADKGGYWEVKQG